MAPPAGIDTGPAPSPVPRRFGSALRDREASVRRVASSARLPVQVLLVAGVAVLARLPFLTAPLTPDEGGFLMVAAQWGRGTSLYGDYWVDRPPLIIGLFQLAALAGDGPVPLRLMGAVVAGLSVALAARVGHLVGRLTGADVRAGRQASLCGAVVAAIFLASPLFGAGEVDGELLAMPFVLAAVVAVLQGHLCGGRAAMAWWVAASALSVAAFAVKQDVVEGAVAMAVVLVATARRDRRRAFVGAGAYLVGAAAMVTVLLVWAATRGTEPVALWDAVVTFRSEASSLIARAAPETARARALAVGAAFVTSGAIGLVALAVASLVRARGALVLPSALTAGVLAWELFAVAAGGSYWLHYLVGIVPGLVLASATAAVGGRVGRRLALVVLAYAGILAVAAVGVASAADGVQDRSSDVAVEQFLAEHARPHDTGVVAFGNPAILASVGMNSPYQELWSLPVRVRDPRLTEFTRVLAGPERPTWVVVDGTSLATWGVDASHAQPVLDRHYRLVHVAGEWNIYHVRPAPR